VQALPEPVRGGSLAELWTFLNVRTKDRPLVLGWMMAALRPRGPYPLLCLHGEQGSGKSTAARIMRSLIDPNTAPVRAEPGNTRDLAIAGNNGWVIALDNISWLPPWLSDALCRLSTGGGFSTRTLYENDQETIFEGQRPTILNGIEELATQPDLLDRSLLVTLPTIPEYRRRTEAEYWVAWDKALPRILGALLDAVSAGLHNLPTVKLNKLPRMADFAQWVVACEPSLGVEPEAFLRTYESNRSVANELALEASPIVAPLRQLLDGDEDGQWSGTPSKLLEALTGLVAKQVSRSKEWPKKPHVLSGKLRRLSPNLRKAGLTIQFGHDGRARQISITRTAAEKSVSSVRSVSDPEENGAATNASAFTEALASGDEALGDDPENMGETAIPNAPNAPNASSPTRSEHDGEFPSGFKSRRVRERERVLEKRRKAMEYFSNPENVR
jgi:hypothetical protein